MIRLVWVGQGIELPRDVRDVLECGLPLVKGGPPHPAYERLESSGFRFGEPCDSYVLVFPGDGPTPDRPLYQLVQVSDRLLGPGGCPWDRAQTHDSLKKYLLEECYEVLEAIDSGSDETLKEELGDLILQPIMHAQMKKAALAFDIDDVANEIVLKLVRRHPHVFGDSVASNPDEVLRNWDAIKKTEKAEGRSILAGVPKGMASLLRAHEISKRAARAGFEWPDIDAVFDKLNEEERELKEAIESGDLRHIESEVGDLLFTAVNLARWAGVEPEEALRKMLDRFSRRFMAMERTSAKPLQELSPTEWDEHWTAAKQEE